MQQNDPYEPAIVWRQALCGHPQREPVEVDVQDGRAEYVLSGPHRMTEGAKIEVIGGQILWTGGRFRPT